MLFIAGIATYALPHFSDSSDVIVATYQRNSGTLAWSVRLQLLSVIPSLIFATGLWSILRSVDIRLATLSLIGAGTLNVWLIIWQSAITAGAVTAKIDPTGDPHPLVIFVNAIDVLVTLPIALWVGAASLAALLGCVFPRWIAWLGLGTAIISIPPALAASDYQSPIIYLNPIVALPYVVWLVSASVAVWRRRITQ